MINYFYFKTCKDEYAMYFHNIYIYVFAILEYIQLDIHIYYINR